MSATSDEDDARTIDAAKRAKHFMVSIFLGPGRGFFRVPIKTLSLARFAGAVLEERLNSARLSMVYAITPEGGAIFIRRPLDEIILRAQEAQAS